MLTLLFLACNSPTFTVDVQPRLIESCGFSSCHGGGEGGLTLDGTDQDFLALVDAAATGLEGATLVVPGDSAASYLHTKLVGGTHEGELMPPPSGGWDQEKIDLVVAWIDAGAPE